MKKNLRKEINGVIINESDIDKIGNFFFEKVPTGQEDRIHLSITLKDQDNIEYELESNEKTENLSRLVSSKKIKSIELNYRDFGLGNYCTLLLVEGNDELFSKSLLKIDGSEDWVTLNFQKLSEIIDVFKRQNIFFKKYSSIIFHTLSVNFGLLALKILSFLLTHTNYSATIENEAAPLSHILSYFLNEYSIIYSLLYLLTAWLVGLWIVIMWWFPLKNWLLNLWPSVEFDFGPEHLRKPKNVRLALFSIITLIIIPALISFML